MERKSYMFRHIPKEERNVECDSENDSKVNAILSYYSDTYDQLCIALPNMKNYGDGPPTDYGDKNIREMARLETRLKYGLSSYYSVLGKVFSRYTSSDTFSLDNKLPDADLDAIV